MLTEGAFVTILMRKSQCDELCALLQIAVFWKDGREYFACDIIGHIRVLVRDTQVTSECWLGTHRSHQSAG